MTPGPAADRVTGALLLALTLLMIGKEWLGWPVFGLGAAAAALAVLALLSFHVRWGRRVFLAIGLVLAAAAWVSRADWFSQVELALERAAFIGAFFSALTVLRHVADTSPAIGASGRFLASQPPGRRYVALTLGGQMFGFLLNYGAITLLGSLATASARTEADAEIRTIRIRRMLLAVQRGFVSTLAWSPLAFSMAISTAVVPGASWAAAVLPCIGSAVLLFGLGWGMDTVFKPRLSGPPPPRRPVEGTASALLPLALLLLLLVAGTGVLHGATGVRTVGVVMLVVPLIATGWLLMQTRAAGPVAARLAQYVTRDLPGYRGEITLLMMAGFIGTLGSVLLVPLVAASGLDLSGVPAWAILVALVWIIPLTGQFGMNPILSVSLMAPVLPTPAEMGVDPSDVILALTAGWALGGASSPYTATTLMVGALGNVSARHVGLIWNGAFTVAGAALLSAWVVAVAAL